VAAAEAGGFGSDEDTLLGLHNPCAPGDEKDAEVHSIDGSEDNGVSAGKRPHDHPDGPGDQEEEEQEEEDMEEDEEEEEEAFTKDHPDDEAVGKDDSMGIGDGFGETQVELPRTKVRAAREVVVEVCTCELCNAKSDAEDWREYEEAVSMHRTCSKPRCQQHHSHTLRRPPMRILDSDLQHALQSPSVVISCFIP
jgi:hypothetical protein